MFLNKGFAFCTRAHRLYLHFVLGPTDYIDGSVHLIIFPSFASHIGMKDEMKTIY